MLQGMLTAEENLVELGQNNPFLKPALDEIVNHGAMLKMALIGAAR
jgi:hypothetical protein